MKEITAAQAASYAQLPLFCGPEENRAVSAERDSRRTGEKSIFFALPGTKKDIRPPQPSVAPDFTPVESKIAGPEPYNLI